MAVSTLIYRLIKNFPGGPSIADLAVSISGACLQLVAITVMNVAYEYLAIWLTKWGKLSHNTCNCTIFVIIFLHTRVTSHTD